MTEKDYILRIIETVGQVLAEMRRALLGGVADPKVMEGDVISIGRRAGIDLELLRQVDPSTLVLLVSPTGEPEPGRTWLTAELFAVEGERLERTGDIDGAIDAWHRALTLYALIDPSLTIRGLPEVGPRVAEVRALLARVLEGPPPGAA